MKGNGNIQLSGCPMWGNIKTLAAAGGGSESINLFQIRGSVDILALRAEVTTALSAGPLTAALFELWDSTAPVALTLNTGVLTSLAIGSIFSKNDIAGVIMNVLSPAVGAMAEHATQADILKAFRVIQKTAANTYLRLTYANGGGGAATGGFRPFVIWRPVSQDGLVIVV